MNAAVELLRGDITRVAADAIVNAANSALRGGGGVDGAIHRAAGPGILEELKRFPGCPTGSAVVTSAGRLRAKWIFHAVGPIYRGRPEDAELLAGAYRACLSLAVEREARTIAFPSISTGAYGYPVEEAAPIAVAAVRTFLAATRKIDRVTFVLFDAGTHSAYRTALERA